MNEKWINDVYALFDKYYSQTRDYREKCRDNENFYKALHWQGVRKTEVNEPQPVTPVIFSTLENILADIMDAYPSATILGQENSDVETGELVTKYVSYILKRRNFKTTYRDKCRDMLKKGMSICEVMWDKSLYYGMGDVNIKNVDIENFLWDDNALNLQECEGVFKYYFYPKKWFVDRFGADVVSKFKSENYTPYEKHNDTYYMLMEYWYKTFDKTTGKQRVHMARLAGHQLLYASEKVMPSGIYDHGMYPFIIDRLYPVSNSITGLSIIDIFKNLQIYADKLDQIIVKNALLSGKMKMLVNKNADIDENALSDWSCEVVRGSRIDDSSVRWFQPNPLNPAVMVHYNNKLEAIKEESGQNSFSRGESGKGITAASAIMAMQEAGSKRSRLIIDSLYDGFSSLVNMVISVIAQNYTEHRYAMIDGKSISIGRDNFIKKVYENGVDFIEFDIAINIEKQTPYKTLYQNELALQLLNAKIIEPNEALSLMSFEGKEAVMEKVRSRTGVMCNQKESK